MSEFFFGILIFGTKHGRQSDKSTLMVVGFVGENLLLVAVRQLYRTELEARMPMDLSIQMSHVQSGLNIVAIVCTL